MSPISLPSFNTLGDAIVYPRVRQGEFQFLQQGETLKPINDREDCSGRTDCRGCKLLSQKVTQEVSVLFLGKETFPSFALCNRGGLPDEQRLISIEYEIPNTPRTQPIMHYGSVHCPREHGEHP